MDTVHTRRPTGHPAGRHGSTPGTIVRASAVPGRESGTITIVFEGPAVPGTLAAFTGVLTMHGLDILSASIVRTGERVEDTFEIHAHPGGTPGDAEIDEMAGQAAAAISGDWDLAAEMDARRMASARPDAEASVSVIADGGATVGFEVIARDRAGLLYDLAATLARHGMRTRSIAVASSEGTATDTFRVVDHTGEAPTDSDAIESVRQALLAAARG